MHRFVSFFFPSFVPSVKDCGTLTVIGTCTCVLVTLTEGRKNIALFPVLKHLRTWAIHAGIRKPGSHKDG